MIDTWSKYIEPISTTAKEKSLYNLPSISESNVVTDLVKENRKNQCCREAKSKTTKTSQFTRNASEDSEVCQRIIMEVMKDRLVASKISALKGRLNMLTLMVNDCEEYLRQKEQLRLRQKQNKSIMRIILGTVVTSITIFIPYLYNRLY